MNLADLQGTARSRRGEQQNQEMETGDWRTKLRFHCAFGHEFEASPRLVPEGGRWCPDCERKRRNYGQRA